MELKHFHDNDPWMLGEEIPNCDLFFSTIWLNGFVSFFDKHIGKAYSKILCRYQGYNLWFYFGEKDSYEVGEHIAEKIITDPEYGEEINRNIIRVADRLRSYSETIPQSGLDVLSNEKIWEIYKTHNEIHSDYYTWAWIPVAVDMFHNNLTNRVKAYLNGVGVSEDKINEYLIILTQPVHKSLIFIEQEDLLKIAKKIETDKSTLFLFQTAEVQDIKKKLPTEVTAWIEEHWKKYYYTKHLWVTGEYTLEDYIGQLKDIFHHGEPADVILNKQYEELKKIKQKKQALLEELKVEEKWRKIFDVFGDFMVTKIYRRYAQLLAVHHMSAILKEIARRNFITEKQVRFMTVEDMRKLLVEEIVDEQDLLQRTKECVYYAERDCEKVFVGAEAMQIIQSLEKNIDSNITELKGETGCVGYAKGRVKIIIRAEDMKKMEPGDILVSIATDPDIVPAMKKAGGIVTEQGGVTSHAAIVSRELGIPCVIGTKIATKILKDGDIVEVDANKGIVTKM